VISVTVGDTSEIHITSYLVEGRVAAAKFSAQIRCPYARLMLLEHPNGRFLREP
jgi:hypothetical protein